MNLLTRLIAAAAVLGLAGFATWANDNATDTAKDAPTKGVAEKACSDKSGCGDAAASCDDGNADCDAAGVDCAKCVEGANVKGSCCEKKMMAKGLDLLVDAALVKGHDGEKVFAAAVAADHRAALNEAAAATRTVLGDIELAIVEIEVELETLCSEAEAAGEKVSCDAKATYERDLKVLAEKAATARKAFAKHVAAAVGNDAVIRVAGDVRAAMAEAEAKRIAEGSGSCGEKKADCEDKAPADNTTGDAVPAGDCSPTPAGAGT